MPFRVTLQWLCFIYLLTFCVSKWLREPVRKERYTIGKSALKHERRQNSQSWVHKLHWCGIIRPFAFGASLPPVFYSSSLIIYVILSWPPKCTEISPSSLSFTLYLFCHFFSSGVVLHALLSSSPVLLCVSCLCSLAVFWIPKCSEYKLEGEWLLTSWSDQFTFTHILTLLCC